MHGKASLCFPEPDWRRSHSDQAGFSLVGVWGDSVQGFFMWRLRHIFLAKEPLGDCVMSEANEVLNVRVVFSHSPLFVLCFCSIDSNY